VHTSLFDIFMKSLKVRGCSSGRLGQLDASVEDLSAALAMCRKHFGVFKGGLGADKGGWFAVVTDHLLFFLAQRCIGKPRPHYTPAQRAEWNRRLRQSFVPGENDRVCEPCGAWATADKRLSKCQRCKAAWYCGAACQVRLSLFLFV
jgi:hypothetical protein